MFKKILFPLISLFLVYQTVDLMSYLTEGETRTLSHVTSFILSFLLTLFITGIFAFPGFAFKTHKLLPASYYAIKNPKRLNLAYQLFGVAYFRVLLMVAFWGRKKQRAKYFNGKKSGFENLLYQSKQSEFGHFGAFCVILVLSVNLIFNGFVQLFFYMNFINIIGNLYPILLQRKHRLRVELITKTE